MAARSEWFPPGTLTALPREVGAAAPGREVLGIDGRVGAGLAATGGLGFRGGLPAAELGGLELPGLMSEESVFFHGFADPSDEAVGTGCASAVTD